MTPPTTRATRRVIGLAALVAVVALAGCGATDNVTDALERAGKTFPVTVTTKHGAVRIAAEPKRVVVLDFQSADAVLALGVTPVAMAKVSYVAGDVQTWTKAALRGAQPVLLDAATDIPLQKIADLRPDLIVGTNARVDSVYRNLSEIAPVISYDGADHWEESTVLVGLALGRREQARTVVANIRTRMSGAAAQHPNFQGRTLALFNFADGQVYAISSPEDVSISFLSSLGFRLAPAIQRAERSDDGKNDLGERRLLLSDEKLKLLDADVILGTSSGSVASLEAFVARPLFKRLSAIRSSAFATLDTGQVTSIAFPSALSIDHAVQNLVPLLDRLTT